MPNWHCGKNAGCVERMLSEKTKRRWRRGTRSVVGLVVALSTLYSLILPALTFAKDTTRSFRVVITEAEHNRLIASKATVTVSFDARIHPEDLSQANVEFTRVELTVASGETESEMRVLKDQNRWSYTGGQWTENTTEPWDWEDGASYFD